MNTRPVDISAVVTTYNRSEMLSRALRALVAQQASGIRYEIVVVDNNSTDDTRAIIEGLITNGQDNIRYVFEPSQGISYGRNAGIAAAGGDIIAFTDDDVVVSENWIATIISTFAKNPAASFVGGKILPNWIEPPPSWLTTHHWWPLALLDQGDEPFTVDASRPLCLPTANAAFRREIFSQVGPYSPQHSGREDHEMYVRMWQHGFHGVYEPRLQVRATVQPERYLKSYHRRWNRQTGKLNSLMYLDEIIARNGSLLRERNRGVTLFGVPASIYRQFVTEGLGWLKETIRRDESGQLRRENQLSYLAGYVSQRYEITTAGKDYSARHDVASFLSGIVAKVAGRPASSRG